MNSIFPHCLDFADRVFFPWETNKGSTLEQSVYWISFLVIGILSCFVIPLLYYTIRDCLSFEEEIYPEAFDTPEARGTPKAHDTVKNPPPQIDQVPPFTDCDFLPQVNTKVIRLESAFSLRRAQYFSKEDERVIKLIAFQENQLPIKVGEIFPTAEHLRLREIVGRADTLAKGSLTRVEFNNLVAQARHEKDLAEDYLAKLSNALEADDPSLPPLKLNLYGCGDLSLTGSILTTGQFSYGNFSGCRLENPSSFFQNVTQCTSLSALHLDLQTRHSLSSFHLIINSLPSLSHLTFSVDSSKGCLFNATCPLKTLQLDVPEISPEIYKNIFTFCPNLTQLTIWSNAWLGEKNVIQAAQQIVDEKRNLAYFGLVLDSPFTILDESYCEVRDSTTICITQLDIHSLFSFNPNSLNFSQISFEFLLRRFSYDPEKFSMLIKEAAQRLSKWEKLNICGQICANGTYTSDWVALSQVIEAFPLEFEADVNAGYNLNLEIILRSALDYALQHNTDPLFKNKIKWIGYILEKLKQSFETSFLILFPDQS
jgi:hypothetical protein